jgi:hypothetical protein
MWRRVLRNSRRIRRAYHVVFVGEEKKVVPSRKCMHKEFQSVERFEERFTASTQQQRTESRNRESCQRQISLGRRISVSCLGWGWVR